MEAPVFTKKRPKQQHIPTRHLLLLFAGRSDVANDDQVELIVVDNSARLFVSYRSAEAARAAMQRLKGTMSTDEQSVRKGPIDAFFCSSSLDKDEGNNDMESVSLETLVDAPPGLTLERNFISADEEQALIAFFDAQKWNDEIKRRVQHYGFSFDYASRSVNPSFAAFTPIPELLVSLFDRLIKAGMPGKPDQISEIVCGWFLLCSQCSQPSTSTCLELASR